MLGLIWSDTGEAMKHFAPPTNVIYVLPSLMDLMSLKVTQNAYFSLSTHTKQLILVSFCYLTAGIIKCDRTQWDVDGRMDAVRTDRREG